MDRLDASLACVMACLFFMAIGWWLTSLILLIVGLILAYG